jgi:predicted RND superfamily exporter protein
MTMLFVAHTLVVRILFVVHIHSRTCSGAYERTDATMSLEDRVATTIDEIGLSIMLTSLTSAIAFGLGCMSSVFSVYWLCLYAMPLIGIVFFYTITFFVALIVLDERRIQQNRRDCCVCLSGPRYSKQNKVTTNDDHDDDRVELSSSGRPPLPLPSSTSKSSSKQLHRQQPAEHFGKCDGIPWLGQDCFRPPSVS